MTRQEWKERLHLIQAFAEGKRVQKLLAKGWTDMDGEPCFDADIKNYRIAQEPTYRPWKPEEVPVGAVVRHKDNSIVRHVIVACTNDIVWTGPSARYSLPNMLANWTMADGSPCGVKEGGE